MQTNSISLAIFVSSPKKKNGQCLRTTWFSQRKLLWITFWTRSFWRNRKRNRVPLNQIILLETEIHRKLKDFDSLWLWLTLFCYRLTFGSINELPHFYHHRFTDCTYTINEAKTYSEPSLLSIAKPRSFCHSAHNFRRWLPHLTSLYHCFSDEQ